MIEFETTDLVELKNDSKLYYVTGVIHDDLRLFVTHGDEEEIEVKFDDIGQHWELKK